MDSKLAKISIIIPCYNQGEFLDVTISSVISQVHVNWECILVDDGSTDNTSAIIKEWVSKDNRIKSYYKENGGLSSARNHGLQYVTGDYIQFLDSDDILHHNKLALSLNQVDEGRRNRIIISNYLHFETSIKESTPPYYNLKKEYFNLEDILFQWDDTITIPIHCGLFSSNLFKDFKFPEKLKAKEDWFMWIHIFSKQPQVSFIDKSLCYYRVHNQSMTNSNPNKIMENNILFFDIIKSQISQSNYIKLLENSNKKFIQKYFSEKNKLNKVKKSKAFKIGLKLEAVLKKAGLLKVSKNVTAKMQEEL